MTPRSRWLLRLFALAGLGFAGAAARVHYRLLTDPTYVSPCDINAVFNCSHVYLSRYGSVGGVSVAVGGVIWFTLVSLMAWLAPADRRTARAGVLAESGGTRSADVGAYLMVLATIGLASILYLGLASYQLRSVCLLCVGTYVCVLGIFVTTALTTTGQVRRLPFRFLEDLRLMTAKPALVVVAILFLTGAASAVALFPREGYTPPQTPAQALTSSEETQFRAAWNAQPRVDLGIPAEGAKVVIVKFNDWLCPACKAMHQLYQPTLDRYAKEMPGAIKYVIKDMLWNSKCNINSGNTIPGHEGSCDAAVAVRIAREKGKADDLITWLFANQERLAQLGMGSDLATNGSSTEIRKHATQLLGITDFDSEYSRRLSDIRRDEADALALHVNSTPTYYINGVRTTDGNGGNLPLQYFEAALKLELSKASGK